MTGKTTDITPPTKDVHTSGVEAQATAAQTTSAESNAPGAKNTASLAEAQRIKDNQQHLQPMSIDGLSPTGQELPNSPKTTQPTDTSTALNGATEIVKDASGKDTQIPLTKLSAGDHDIQLKDGREFLMHVPANDGQTSMPVMFVIAPSLHPQFNPKDFAAESGMSKAADDPNHKFIAVYALPEKHDLGVGATTPAYAWNAPGSLISQTDQKSAGYDDTDYIKSVADLLPKIANVDSTHKDWGAIGFSQGAVFLNSLVANEANLFPTIGLVGSSMQNDYQYNIKPGNAQNVDIVNLLGDKSTLPFDGLRKQSATYIGSEILRDLDGERLMDHIDALAPINNADQDPQKQEAAYKALLGQSSNRTVELGTPVASATKDTITEYTSDDPNNQHHLVITNLAVAQHSYPGPDPSGARTNAQPKYTEFDTTGQIVKMFNTYNDSVDKK